MVEETRKGCAPGHKPQALARGPWVRPHRGRLSDRPSRVQVRQRRGRYYALVFDRKLSFGQSASFAACIEFRHTYGALCEVSWSD